MTDRNILARYVLATSIIEKQAKAKEQRAELAQNLDAEDLKVINVRHGDGTELGTVSLVSGRMKARIIDEPAFRAWVKENHPEMIREIVENAYLNRILKDAEEAGTPVDMSTGELIPGIDITVSDPYVKVNPNPVAKQRMQELLESSGLLQLPASPPPAIVETPDVSFWDADEWSTSNDGSDPW